jgi:L-serine dehydratase
MVFDILGPIMIGPSSSHTAGAARLGKVARDLVEGQIRSVTFGLHGSFADTYQGHGTDRALLAGVLGMEPDDEGLVHAKDLARKKGLIYSYVRVDLKHVHPNTVKFIFVNESHEVISVTGSSLGGGQIVITKINDFRVRITGNAPTLIIQHTDTPGVISKVSAVIAESGVNIADMRVRRAEKGRQASMIIETDESIPARALDMLRAYEWIQSAKQIEPQ